MKPEKQRIAIAEACGWKWENSKFQKDRRRLISPSYDVCIVWKDGTLGGNVIPDYLNDLNAIHEALNVLTDMQWHNYESNLRTVCKGCAYYEGAGKELLRATAEQCAESFLRTIGKWEDEA